MDREDLIQRLEDRYTPAELIEILDLPFYTLYELLEEYILTDIDNLDIGDIEYESDEA